MALDTEAPRSRRTILAATLGGLGGYIASALGRPAAALAANGDTVTVGGSFVGTNPTAITNSTGDAIQATNTSTGASGLYGHASAGSGTTYGVFGRSDSTAGTGVAGVGFASSGSTRGVYGESTSPSGTGIYGLNSSTTGASSVGVYGEARSQFSRAIFGKNTASYGQGVRGECNVAGGVGVHGFNSVPSGSAVGARGYAVSPDGIGVEGWNSNGIGVRGYSGDTVGVLGVSGLGATGVQGYSGDFAATPAARLKTGVYGYAAQDASARGVYGQTTAGQGVRGEATTGVGLQGVATSGVALAVAGRAVFSRSGRTSVPANASYVDVTVSGGLASSANVLALLQASRSGVWVRAVRTNYPSSGNARIYLNKVASTTTTTPVAWFVLN